MLQNKNGFSFNLNDGKITNIDDKGSFSLSFKETTYELSKFDSKTRSYNKLDETESTLLIDCIIKFFNKRKDSEFRCVDKNSFIIKNVYENPQNKFERIVVPFSDGKKTMNIVTNLKDAYESNGQELINDFEKNISLAIIDDTWKTHLRKMDELKQAVQLAVHEQKDPLLIYKFESFELFKEMINQLNRDTLSFLIKF